MASDYLKQTIQGYENYITKNGIDEQVIDAYIEASKVAINGENDVSYGLRLANRSKGIIERFCIDATGGTIWDLEKYAFENKTCDTKGKGTDYFVIPVLQKYGEDYYCVDCVCDNTADYEKQYRKENNDDRRYKTGINHSP